MGNIWDRRFGRVLPCPLTSFSRRQSCDNEQWVTEYCIMYPTVEIARATDSGTFRNRSEHDPFLRFCGCARHWAMCQTVESQGTGGEDAMVARSCLWEGSTGQLGFFKDKQGWFGNESFSCGQIERVTFSVWYCGTWSNEVRPWYWTMLILVTLTCWWLSHSRGILGQLNARALQWHVDVQRMLHVVYFQLENICRTRLQDGCWRHTRKFVKRRYNSVKTFGRRVVIDMLSFLHQLANIPCQCSWSLVSVLFVLMT